MSIILACILVPNTCRSTSPHRVFSYLRRSCSSCIDDYYNVSYIHTYIDPSRSMRSDLQWYDNSSSFVMTKT